LAVADIALDEHLLLAAVGDADRGAVGQVVQRVGIGEREVRVRVDVKKG
jgi:hypothetical protein